MTLQLSQSWTLWGHLPKNPDWSLTGYVKICTFTTLDECVLLMATLPNELIDQCMLFLMKDDIPPLWEHDRNKNGGYFSYSVPNKTVNHVWKEVCYHVVTQNMSKNPDFNDKLNGVTISPKRNFCIIKLWMSSCSHGSVSVIENVSTLSKNGVRFEPITNKI